MKYRYLLISILVLLALCSYAFYKLYESEKERKINEVLIHQKIHAVQAARNLSESFVKWNNVLFYLSQNRDVALMNNQSKHELTTLLNLFKGEIKGITRLDKNGKIIYTTPFSPGAIGSDISKQNHIIKILFNHKPIVSDVFKTVQGYQAVVIHYPIFSGKNFDGTIAFLLDYQHISKRILEVIKIGNSGYAWMISAEGIIIYHPAPWNLGKSIFELAKDYPSLKIVAKKMLANKSGSDTYVYLGINGETQDVKKIVYFMPIKINNTFWSIAVVYAENELTASLVSFKNKLIIIFILIFGGGIFLSYVALKALFVIKESKAREAAEKNLKESEGRFKQLVEQLPQFIWTASFTGAFDYLSNQWIEYTGIPEKELSDYGWLEQIHAEDRKGVIKDWRNAVKSGSNFQNRSRIKSQNGNYFWFELQALPLKNLEGKIVKWFGSATNIQKEVDMVETLKENEERYRLISWATSDYMFASKIDKNGFAKTQWVAGAFEAITGYTFDEYIKRGGWRSMLFPEDIELDERDMDKLRANQSVVSEIRTLTKSGKVVWVRVYAHPVWDERTNSLVGINGAVQDITERKLAEEELKKLYSATEQSPAAIVITDINGYVEYVNSTFTKISGYPFTEIKGKIFRILHPDNCPGNVSDQIWQTIKNGLEWEGEYLNIRKDGTHYWESSLVSLVKDNNGKITHLLATQEDITEKKKNLEELILAKEKAEEAIHVKNVFLANMSHELRTPLIGILGYSEMLERELIHPDKLEMAHGIIRSGNRLLNTLNLILDLTRIESDRFEINLKIVNLIDEIYYTFNTFKGAAHEKGINFTKEIRNDKLYAKVDERMFRIIMENLINNAIKFTSRGSVKLIADIEDEKTICISVNDTGIGIPEDYLDVIFEEFRQVSEGINRDYQGTGLGLSISKKYISLLGGTVSVQSRSGVGSSFFIRFPLEENFD
jgi:PAS domain S-box-containing protein